MSPPAPPFSVREAADLLQVTEETIRDNIRRGEIAATKVGWKWRIPAAEMSRLTGEPERAAS